MGFFDNLNLDTSVGMSGAADVAGGLANVVSGIVGGRARRKEQALAREEFERRKAQFEQADYFGTVMANPFSNVTVNQRQANFLARQQQQGLGNAMAQLRGAAGGSGIAGLAQSISQQQMSNLEQISGSIGQQESVNQRLMGQGNIYRAQSLADAEQRVRDKGETIYTLAAQRKQIADQARKDATEALAGGLMDVGVGIGKMAIGV